MARTFRDEAHKQQRQILVCYKIKRRLGKRREEALQQAIAMRARLAGAFAVLDASDYKADPIRLAAQANAA